jgi:hypothetical protein
MSQKFIIFSTIIGILIVLFGLVWALKCTSNTSISKEEKDIITTTKTLETEGASSDVIHYKKGKCLIINRLQCPPGWGPVTVLKCEEKLSECQGNYEALQKFCNVNCQEDLEVCYDELRQAKDYCYSSQYPYLGYHI